MSSGTEHEGNGLLASARFANVSAVAGLDFPDDGRAVAVMDWDEDGDQDVWLRNRSAPRMRVLRNRSRELHGDQRFVSFRLVGTACNRDAIGARVELEVADGSVTRSFVSTVTAGDAFLSQSSRRIHVGLGSNAQLLRNEVTVHWPGGASEVFRGVNVGAHHILTEGSRLAEVLPPRRAVDLTVRPLDELAPTSAARIILPGRIPFPTLTLDDEPSGMSEGEGPMLLTLWSQTCPNCRAELREFASARATIEARNVGILAVCVDGIDVSPEAAAAAQRKASDWLREIQFPFVSTAAPVDFVQRVQYFQQALFDMHPSFVVPMSFLLDEQARVVAIYRGVVSTEVLVADAELTRARNEQLRDLASPFAGSWFTKAATDSETSEIVGRQLFRTSPPDAVQLFQHAMDSATEPLRKSRLASQLLGSLLNLARDESQESHVRDRYFREAILLAPQSPAIRHEYALFLASAGEADKAESQLREVLRLRPNSATAKRSLELILQKKGGAD